MSHVIVIANCDDYWLSPPIAGLHLIKTIKRKYQKLIIIADFSLSRQPIHFGY